MKLPWGADEDAIDILPGAEIEVGLQALRVEIRPPLAGLKHHLPCPGCVFRIDVTDGIHLHIIAVQDSSKVTAASRSDSDKAETDFPVISAFEYGKGHRAEPDTCRTGLDKLFSVHLFLSG